MALAIPFGLVIGLSLGMLGGGGAVLAVPVFIYVLDQDVHSATTSSLVVVAVAALVGGVGQAREHRICWRHARVLALPAVVGIAIGTAANQAVDGELLLALFALVMLAAASATWHKASGGERDEGDPDRACPPVVLGRDLAAGFALGALTGFFGVGGGFVVVPTLALALGMPMRFAIGTSLIIVTAASAIGLTAHLIAGNELDLGPTLAVAAACVVGALAGAPLARRIPQQTLGKAFSAIVIAVAGYLLAATVFLGGPPGN